MHPTRGLRAQTRVEYQRNLERHAVPFFGATRLAELEPRDIKRLITTMIDQGLASNSVRRRLAPLRALLATALEDGLISRSPAAGVRVQRSPADRPEHDRRRAAERAGVASAPSRSACGESTVRRVPRPHRPSLQ